MIRVAHLPVRADEVGQPAHFAATHGVGLTCKREGTCTGFANLCGGQMQIDQGRVFGGATARLVQALAIQAERCTGRGKQFGGQEQVVFFNAAGLGRQIGRVVADCGFECIKAGGMGRNVGGVNPAFPQHDVQHPVEERDVRAWLNRQVEVSNLCRIGAARVAKNDFQRRIGSLGVFNTAKQNRVRVSCVAANDEYALGVVHVVITVWWGIGPQRLFVACYGAAHAQARVGVYIVGAQQALGQLVEDVIVFGQQLARNIKTYCIGSVVTNDLRKAFCCKVERAVP